MRNLTLQYLMATCILSMAVHAVASGEAAAVSDADVSAILEREPQGVFYAWSPHMPLSVDGLREILVAGERLDITVIPLLSSHSNSNYARDRIHGRGLPESVLRQGRSPLLIERDLFVHAPAILIFAEGGFVSPVLPGFRYANDYVELIDRFLGAANKEPD